MYQHRKYFASRDSVVRIVAEVKSEFLEAHPEYKIFDGELGSYVARAVQSRNETGIERKEGFLQDAAAQSVYFDELYRIARKEIDRCKLRFADQLPVSAEVAEDTPQTPDYGDVYIPHLS